MVAHTTAPFLAPPAQCVRSPLLADKAVGLLLAMLGPQLDVSKRVARTASLAPTAMRPGGSVRVAGSRLRVLVH